jgi:hypothetical protein
MMRRRSASIVSVLCICLAAESIAGELEIEFPGVDWLKVKPESVGFSSDKLAVLRSWLKTQQTTAVHISVDGREIFEYGDVHRTSKVASVRKSVLAMLYGNYVASGQIDLGKTVVQLSLNDVQPFLDIEKNATLYHLLTARSGIYHPMAQTIDRSVSPPRIAGTRNLLPVSELRLQCCGRGF